MADTTSYKVHVRMFARQEGEKLVDARSRLRWTGASLMAHYATTIQRVAKSA